MHGFSLFRAERSLPREARPRGALLLAVVVCCGWWAPSASALWQPGVRAAIAYAHTRAGQASFCVRTEHRAWGWRAVRTVPSASVLRQCCSSPISTTHGYETVPCEQPIIV